MEKQKIVLIIAIVILIGLVMALSGYIIAQTQQKTENVNNTTKNLSVTNNTTGNITQTKKQETNYIGKAKAKKIAKNILDEYGTTEAEIRSVDFVTINGVPLYRVNYYDYYILYDGTETGWGEVYIGAKNGKYYDSYGERVEN